MTGQGVCIQERDGDLLLAEPYLSFHLNVCGNPGMGKSTVMMHLLEQVEERGEVAIIAGDPKAEYYERFFRPERGDWNIDPASNACCYWASEEEAVDRLAADPWGRSFIPDPPGQDESFFPRNARAALAGLLAKHNAWNSPDDMATCENLAHWFGEAENELLRRLANIPGTRAFNPRAQNQLAGLTGTLAPLAPSFAAMPRCEEGRPKFTVREWAEKRDGSWIFFTSTSETRDGSLPLQTAICDSLLRAIEKKRPGAPRVWVFCDELSLLKRMPSLIHAAALLRASGNPLVLGYQSSAQIEMEYGRPGMQALLGMPYTQICFASTDPVIQKHIEEQCGYAMREKLSENMPSHLHHGNKQARSSSLTSQQVAHEPVVMASEIGGLLPYEFVLKQQDMVIRGRIARNNRQRQTRYVRRLIPELVIEEPISAEDELEDELAVPVDEDPVPIDPEPQPPKKRGGRPSKATGPTLFDQSQDVSPME